MPKEAGDDWIGPYGRLNSPPTKTEGGETLRRRWMITGQRKRLAGTQLESAYIRDVGQPDVETRWDFGPTLPNGLGKAPDCLTVTGWSYPACVAAYEQAWNERASD
ncbi:hypothetical protein AB0M89_13130 [Streptomyces microflavus]|uniref:hypothetical protein n=1 Tax=Streptomyces microflavus TaxID=1919 RepID=UPI003447EEF5